MAKPPIDTVRWGVDGSDADASNLTAPDSGRKDEGWPLNFVPASGIDNYWQNKAYRWFQYLNSGDLELGTVSAVDGLFITFDDVTIFNFIVNAAAGLSLGAGFGISSNGHSSWGCGDGITHDSELDVDGLLFTREMRIKGGELSGVLRYRATSTSGGTPATGNNNNYAPADLTSVVSQETIILRLTSNSGSPVVTGLAGGSSGRFLHLPNCGSVSIQFTHNDTGNSTAANCFFWPTAATITVAPDQAITIWYDSVISRWRLFSKNF